MTPALLAHPGWLGTIPGWLTLGALIALGLLTLRSQLGPALGYYREANSALVKEREELRDKLATERKENARLRARTDLEPIQAALLAAIEQHEVQSARRDDKMLSVLGLIADRLGPEAPE